MSAELHCRDEAGKRGQSFCYPRGQIQWGQGPEAVGSGELPPSETASCGLGWIQIHCIAKARSDFLLFLPLPPKSQHARCMPPHLAGPVRFDFLNPSFWLREGHLRRWSTAVVATGEALPSGPVN